MLSTSTCYAGQSLPLQATYGAETGCQFAKDRTFAYNDGRVFVSKLGIEHHEDRCSFLEVADVKNELSRSGIVGAWHVKAICVAEGDAYPEDLLVVETKDEKGKMSLELRYSLEESEVLQRCD